uniref:flagellar hook-length control protein FliK n=1 Tax=uncultured Arthrobacter sp. TaxID=114050 RepID=UPI0025EF015A
QTYRRLIALRHAEPVVVDGDFTMLLPQDERVYAFTRSLAGTTLLVPGHFSGAPAPAGQAPAAPAGAAPHLQGPVPGLQPPAVGLQAPTVAPVPGTGTAATPAPPPAALAAQLSRPVTALSGKAPGEHVLVLKVTPEDLGPVTVRALIGADSSVRVELFAPTDGGRDALKAVLAELKRDLAGSGLNASLDLSSRNQPGEPGAEGSRRGPAQQHPGRSPAGRDDDAPQPDRRPRLSDDAPSLNVMA